MMRLEPVFPMSDLVDGFDSENTPHRRIPLDTIFL